MNTPSSVEKAIANLKHLTLAVAVSAGLTATSAQALTTTDTYQLGAEGSGTTVQPGLAV